MEDPPSFKRLISFIIGDSGFECLDLKFLGAGGRQFYCHVFIESHREEVGLSGYFFLSVLLQGELLLRVPVESLQKHVLQVLVVGEDEEVDTEDAVDLRTQVFKVYLCESLDLELHAGGHDDLLGVLVHMQDAETSLEGLDVELAFGVRHYWFGWMVKSSSIK